MLFLIPLVLYKILTNGGPGRSTTSLIYKVYEDGLRGWILEARLLNRSSLWFW